MEKNKEEGEEYRDVVCHMRCDPEKAEKVDYKGKTYYFCTDSCKQAFEKQPEYFISGYEKTTTEPGSEMPA